MKCEEISYITNHHMYKYRYIPYMQYIKHIYMDIPSSSPSWSCCSLIRNTKDTGELSKLALLPCTLHWLGISLFLFFTSILRHNICHSVSTVWSPHTKINSNILLWNGPFSELRFMYNFFHKNITAFVANNTCAKQGEFSFLKNIPVILYIFM